MRFGLPAATIAAIHGALRGHRQVERVPLYGSRARGTFKHGSDVDLALVGGDELTLAVVGRVASEFDDQLQSSAHPGTGQREALRPKLLPFAGTMGTLERRTRAPRCRQKPTRLPVLPRRRDGLRRGTVLRPCPGGAVRLGGHAGGGSHRAGGGARPRAGGGGAPGVLVTSAPPPAAPSASPRLVSPAATQRGAGRSPRPAHGGCGCGLGTLGPRYG